MVLGSKQAQERSSRGPTEKLYLLLSEENLRSGTFWNFGTDFRPFPAKTYHYQNLQLGWQMRIF